MLSLLTLASTTNLPDLRVRADVRDAIANNRPVVALESTIISHGMPYPKNLEVARAVEAVELPPGLRMTLYQQDDFSGLSLNVTGSTACLRDTACGHPPHTTNWAYPPQGCSAHDWAGQAGSLKIEYVENGPPYPPRTGIETGARAWLR